MFKEDLKSRNVEAVPQDVKHSSAVDISGPHNSQRNTEMSNRDGAEMNLYQSDGKAKARRKEGYAHDLKRDGDAGGSVVAWACMAASETTSNIQSHWEERDTSIQLPAKPRTSSGQTWKVNH